MKRKLIDARHTVPCRAVAFKVIQQMTAEEATMWLFDGGRMLDRNYLRNVMGVGGRATEAP